MGLNRDSTGGSNGMSGAFYQDAWEIIGKDIHQMVVYFFCGYDLPRFVTHTNLVILPKTLVVNTFSVTRQISLSNFINKIFFRIIHEILKGLLPDIISEERVGFAQGKRIVENILEV